MKRTVSGIMLTLLLISTLILAFNVQPVKAGTITVPDDYPTIQEAINHANEGDTVFVGNGTYYENVVINKTISLIGESRRNTIIDGNGALTVIRVISSSCHLSQLAVTNTYNSFQDTVGILINEKIVETVVENVSIKGSWVIGNCTVWSGIKLSRFCNNNTIRYSSICGCCFGILLDSVWEGRAAWNEPVHDNLITCNEIFRNRMGIGLAPFANFNEISGNNIYGNEDGVWIDTSDNNLIYHNDIHENQRNTYSYSSTNRWDNGYPSGGNYWSNYNSTDLHSGPYQNITGSDGIGDTPYVIDENNRDNYPLMFACTHDPKLTVKTFGIGEISSRVWIDNDQPTYCSPVNMKASVGLHTVKVSYGFLEAGPEEGSYIKYSFSHWEDGSTNSFRSLMLTEDETIIAFYKWQIIYLW